MRLGINTLPVLPLRNTPSGLGNAAFAVALPVDVSSTPLTETTLPWIGYILPSASCNCTGGICFRADSTLPAPPSPENESNSRSVNEK